MQSERCALQKTDKVSFLSRISLRSAHAPKARTLRSVRSVNRHAPVAAIYDFNFSVPAGTEFCEVAVKWKSVADFYPQGVRGIRKAAKLPTAAQVPRTARNKFKSVFRRDMCALQRGFSCPLRGNSPSGRKHFTRSERRIVRYKRTIEAQSAANPFRKSGFATFSTVSKRRPKPSLFLLLCCVGREKAKKRYHFTGFALQ